MAARVFTEWTCEGSLKLPDMIREGVDADGGTDPLSAGSVCQYMKERPVCPVFQEEADWQYGWHRRVNDHEISPCPIGK